MASDSEKDSCPNAQEEISAKEREEYADDPAAWLSKLFHATRHEVHEEVKYYSEQQELQAKNFLQTVVDSHKSYLSVVESRLIFWLGIIAIIVAASAGVFGVRDGLVVGAIVVGSVVVGRVYLSTWLMRKRINRLDRFRKRFRELLDSVNDIRWQTRSEEMVAEDKAFLEKYKDSILFPSVIPYERRKGICQDAEFEHIRTLYLEYCYPGHLHPWPDPNDPNSNTKLKCELCTTADRVRKHIEGAISAYESAIESERQKLVAQIDSINAEGAVNAKDFLDDYRKHRGLYYVPEDLAKQDEKLLAWLNSLCDKQYWTFEDADKVRELCRIRENEVSAWGGPWEQTNSFELIFDKLTREMKSAATRCGPADTWDWYDSARDRLATSGGAVADIRRIIGRHEPKAMFRELEEGGQFMDITIRLPGITNWGYDPKLVARERKKARTLISKERDEYDRELDREFQAARDFVSAERRER